MKLVDIVLEWVLALLVVLSGLALLGAALSDIAGLIWTEYSRAQLTPVQQACIREAGK